MVARKTILVCDNCSKEVGEGKGAVMRLNYTDARRGSRPGIRGTGEPDPAPVRGTHPTEREAILPQAEPTWVAERGFGVR